MLLTWCNGRIFINTCGPNVFIGIKWVEKHICVELKSDHVDNSNKNFDTSIEFQTNKNKNYSSKLTKQTNCGGNLTHVIKLSSILTAFL